MLIQAARIVLCQHRNLLYMGIGHIAQRKVDAAVAAGNRHCTDRSLLGQLLHPVIISTC